MKLHYVMFICALTAMGALLLIFSPKLVLAENNADYLAAQPQINALVSLAIPPYKWDTVQSE